MSTNTYVALRTTTVGTAVSSVTLDLTGITGYTDLVLVFDGTTSGSINNTIRVGNGTIDTGLNYSCTILSGNGSSAVSTRRSNDTSFQPNYNGYTNSTQSNMIVHFMNYSNTNTHKTILSRSNNASTGVDAVVGLWRSTSAINQIQLLANGGYNWQAGSTFTIYGIAADTGAYTTKATGGTVTTDQFWVYHTFTSSGTFAPTENILADVLVVAGGGGSTTGPGGGGTGGGGAGGLIGFTNQSLTPSSYTVTVGAGGTDSNGSNSVFGSLTAAVGGGRGGASDTIGSAGGSGGGTGFRTPSSGTAAGTAGQGNAGGNTSGGYPNFNSGGGGGAGAAGGTGGGNGGAGGIGSNAYSAWATATSTGQSGYYAGGGGGMVWYPSGSAGAGGTGGGGTGAASSTSSGSNGLANTGGGAGGSAQTATTGGSGLVIVRYPK